MVPSAEFIQRSAQPGLGVPLFRAVHYSGMRGTHRCSTDLKSMSCWTQWHLRVHLLIRLHVWPLPIMASTLTVIAGRACWNQWLWMLQDSPLCCVVQAWAAR